MYPGEFSLARVLPPLDWTYKADDTNICTVLSTQYRIRAQYIDPQPGRPLTLRVTFLDDNDGTFGFQMRTHTGIIEYPFHPWVSHLCRFSILLEDETRYPEHPRGIAETRSPQRMHHGGTVDEPPTTQPTYQDNAVPETNQPDTPHYDISSGLPSRPLLERRPSTQCSPTVDRGTTSDSTSSEEDEGFPSAESTTRSSPPRDEERTTSSSPPGYISLLKPTKTYDDRTARKIQSQEPHHEINWTKESTHRRPATCTPLRKHQEGALDDQVDPRSFNPSPDEPDSKRRRDCDNARPIDTVPSTANVKRCRRRTPALDKARTTRRATARDIGYREVRTCRFRTHQRGADSHQDRATERRHRAECRLCFPTTRDNLVKVELIRETDVPLRNPVEISATPHQLPPLGEEEAPRQSCVAEFAIFKEPRPPGSRPRSPPRSERPEWSFASADVNP